MSALAEQVALVTGGASGIGRAVVRRFVQEGCRVGVADVNAPALASLRRELGDRVITVEADVSLPAGNQWVVDKTVEAFGKLDVFVGNAGIFDGFSDAPAIDTAVEAIETNAGLGIRGLRRTRGGDRFNS
jgi:NAD(P)-dependent dehydrogenase (short-subunit alcohol dehydrogenase family)